ncbi:MAG: oligoendopeptidase F [Pirellulales bacterium]
MKRLPARSQVKPADTWDLASLFVSQEEWEKLFQELDGKIAQFETFKGRLGEDAKTLAAALQFDLDFDRACDRLGTYAFLRSSEDQANSESQRMVGRFQNLSTRAGQAASYMRPEIMAIPAAKMKKLLASAEVQPYKLVLERILRYKPYTLSEKEERLLAMQGEMSQVASKTFRQLLDADLKFGSIKNEKGQQVELSSATFSQFLVSPSRVLRKTAFHQFYEQFASHENTLAATLHGSIQKDVYHAKVRNFTSSLDASLFADDVPRAVYDNLIESVHKHLPSLYKYFELRRRKMKLKEIHHYDTYVPILADLEKKHSWKQASDLVVESLAPLGKEYTDVLTKGLHGRWCDRYPNQGKQSGAFSSGTYDSDPYILMNFKPEVFNDVFTLAHEAGHSMHSHFSAKNQPYQYYGYAIFVAEVASTFNEQLLSHHLLTRTTDPRERAYLLNRAIDDIRGTIFRQTMFAEFERTTHAMVEAGEPLTVQAFKTVYRGLLERYFGPDFALDNELSLECLRIPHFYRSFYVYKYATGLSAAIALSQRVLTGGVKELNDYLTFLKSGCSKFPLDLLRDAGVDMASPMPVDTALTHFSQLVDELASLLKS